MTNFTHWFASQEGIEIQAIVDPESGKVELTIPEGAIPSRFTLAEEQIALLLALLRVK